MILHSIFMSHSMQNTSSKNVKTILLLTTLSGFLIILGHYFAGGQGFLIALAASGILSLGAYWFSDTLILSLYRAKEINQDDKPLLYATVAYLAEKAPIPRPKIYLIQDKMPNAFATGRSPDHASIAVTTGLLEVLNKDELAGIISHEIAHILNRDTLLATIAASVGGAVTMLANFAQGVFVFGMGGRREGQGNNRLAQMLMSMLAPLFAIIVQMSVSRAQEFDADETAVDLCGDPMWLANALRKLNDARERYSMDDVEQNPSTAHLFTINPLRTKKWKILFNTHPPLGDRIERLECLL
jgi:heat shock protein HtpX